MDENVSLPSALPLEQGALHYNTWTTSPLERGRLIICSYLGALSSASISARSEHSHGDGEYLVVHRGDQTVAGWVFPSFGPSRVHADTDRFIWQDCAGFHFYLPVVGLFAILATPSLSFWLGHYLEFELRDALSYVVAKLALAWFFLALWSLWVNYKKAYPRLQSFLFSLALCAVALFALAQRQLVQNGAPIQLNLEELQSGEWLARKAEVTERDLNFFTGCTWIGRMEFFDNQSSLSVLALQVADITNLHPMPICLKSGGSEIVSSSQIYLNVHGKPVQVNELEILTGGTRSMAYSVYSNDEFSTGNFARFRLLRKDRKIWWHYQIITPVEPDKETAHRRVESFLNTFAVELKTPAEESPLEK